MKYFILFICSMIIPLVNPSSISSALMSYEIDFVYSMISLGTFGIAIKYLKRNEHPIVIILLATLIEDLITNLLCQINWTTYFIQMAIIIAFVLHTNYKNRNTNT